MSKRLAAVIGWALAALVLVDAHLMIWFATWPDAAGIAWICVGCLWLVILTLASLAFLERAYKFMPT